MEMTELAKPKFVDADKLVQRTVCGSGAKDDPALVETPNTT